MTYEEKLQLYQRAKDAYYNGEEIMSDIEFDALERELGLENKSNVGARHNPSYTVQHPFIMGSLSKVQIHRANGVVDWESYCNDAKRYFKNNHVIVTPKYDGCSFELHWDRGNIEISTRGDGQYGRDIKRHLIGKFDSNELNELSRRFSTTEYTLRGEVLVDKNTFNDMFNDEFVNPRSFVSAVLNHDYDEMDSEFIQCVKYLDVVVYDFHININGKWTDLDWPCMKQYVNNSIIPQYWTDTYINVDNFEQLYNDFDSYRHTCQYALDGIVIKPIDSVRVCNLTESRPKDCVAIKFMPILVETTVDNITWNLGKTLKWVPIINVKPVKMDGKVVSKCSGHNYRYLLDKKISAGTKIVMSLAGDIIPFLYKVTDSSAFDVENLNKPSNSIYDGVNLIAVLTPYEKAKRMLIASAHALSIPTIGDKCAATLFDNIHTSVESTNEFFGIENMSYKNNILLCKPHEIYDGLNRGKIAKNAQKSFESTIENLTLEDIIVSCNFALCGKRVAHEIANKLMGVEYSFDHMATIAWKWCEDDNSDEMNAIYDIMNAIGKTFNDFMFKYNDTQAEVSTAIPIIMTGEPNGYATKAEFLKMHPEYRNTTSWKEVKILFTNSMSSNTAKMKKAREKNIEIMLY